MTDNIVTTKVLPRWRILWGALRNTNGPLVVVSHDEDDNIYVASTHSDGRANLLLVQARKELADYGRTEPHAE